jgi:hypothetical protein
MGYSSHHIFNGPCSAGLLFCVGIEHACQARHDCKEYVLHMRLKKAETPARLGGHELKSQGEMFEGDEGEVSIWGRGWGLWDEMD